MGGQAWLMSVLFLDEIAWPGQYNNRYCILLHSAFHTSTTFKTICSVRTPEHEQGSYDVVVHIAPGPTCYWLNFIYELSVCACMCVCVCSFYLLTYEQQVLTLYDCPLLVILMKS